MTTAKAAVVQERPATPSVTRLMSPGLDVALQQFSNPEVLTAGKVNVIALDAVAARFGARWAMRREQVHHHVDTMLVRQLGSQGYHLRISDMDILVCQPTMPRLSGQAFCLRLLREIFHHFLGESEQADIGVHEVLSLSLDAIEARRVNAGAVDAAEASECFGRASAVRNDPPQLGGVDIWTPFVAANGRRVEVACTLQPVRELRGGAVIALRFCRRVTDAASGAGFDACELARLSGSDRLRIDLGAMVEGFNLLRDQAPDARPPALIIPISFSSLSNVDGRACIVSAFQEARRHAAQGVICELGDVDGVPATTMLAAAAMIRPFSLFLIGHAQELTRSEARTLREVGLRGVSLTCPTSLGPGEFAPWAKAAIAAGKTAAKSVLLYGVPSEADRDLVRALGGTHASVRGPANPTTRGE
jgi:hypothetical protein